MTQLRRCMRTQLKWAKKSKSKYVRYRRRAVGAPLWIALCFRSASRKNSHLRGKFLRVLGRTCSLFSLNGKGSSISVACTQRLTCLLMYMWTLVLSAFIMPAPMAEKNIPFARQTLGKIITSTRRQKADIYKGWEAFPLSEAQEALY